MRRLLDALKNERSEVPLDIASLELAGIEFPGLDCEPCLLRLNSIAAQIESQLPPSAPPLDFIDTMNGLLFGTLQFRGNDEDYYDPRTSVRLSVSATLAS